MCFFIDSFSSVCFVIFHVLSFFILLLVFRCLFSDKREKERVCMGGMVGRIWEELGEVKPLSEYLVLIGNLFQ